MTAYNNPEKGALLCEAWEAMLTDALDGTLSATDAAAFTAHSDACVACGELLEEAKRGTEWLQFLREAPPAPNGLVERILAGTSGMPQAAPLVPAGAAALPGQPWLGVPMQLLHRGLLRGHVAESRILMTLAMAFFSIALTLNLTGVRLNQLKLSDLSPSALVSSVTHQYFATSKNVQRYYANLRFVYEVESRLSEIRQTTPAPAASQPEQSPQAEPAQPSRRQPPQSAKPQGAQPGTDPGNRPDEKPAPRPAGKTGGSARQDDQTPHPQPRRVTQPGAAVLARLLVGPNGFQNRRFAGSLPRTSMQPLCLSQLPPLQLHYPGKIDPQSERSLV